MNEKSTSSKEEPKQSIQKVKLVGFLWTTRTLLAIARDFLLIILLLILIVGAVFLIAALPQITSGLGTLMAVPQLMQTMQNGNPQALLQGLQEQVAQGDWDGALAQVRTLESIIPKEEMPLEDQQRLAQLKQALEKKDKKQFDLVMADLEKHTEESNSQQ